MSACDGSCHRPNIRDCACGMIRDGVMVRSGSIRVSALMMDSAPPSQERKTLTMMNDTEIRDMRASVRGMPVSKAAALPIYDEFRNILDDSGQSMARARAFYDGAVYDGPGIDPTPENVMALGDAAYAYQKMVSDMANAHRQPVNDNRAPREDS